MAVKYIAVSIRYGEWERSGLKFDNIGLTFSSLTMLLGGKSLKIRERLNLCLFCHLKVMLLISECTFMILAYFVQKLKRPLVILPL